jgi:hypothetical protein
MRVVLLGAGGTGTAFAIAMRLKAHWAESVRLVVTDTNPAELVTTSLFADAFIQAPPASDAAFAPFLRDLLIRANVATYIPILNDEIRLAATLAQDPAFAHVDIWSSPTHALCTDKDSADAWLTQLGVRTPARIDPETAHDPGPWFAKPRNGFGSRGTGPLTRAAYRALSPETQADLLLQEICAPPEVTVDSFYDAATDQAFAYCRERLETKAGVCTKARLFADPELQTFARLIGQGLNQRGTICFQVMKSAAGWAVTDLNLRSGAGTALTCAAGFDVLAAAYACRIGEDYSRFLRPLAEGETFILTRQYAEYVMRHAP